jgi:threonyl-tRNA synthetase
MIHRVLLGAIERFFAVLIEHCKGNLPTWLAPVQVMVLPVSDDYVEYAEKVHRELLTHGIRVEIDSNPSTIGYKVRQSELQKIPYMVICGEREAKENKVSVRKHTVGDIGLLTVKKLVDKIKAEENQYS